ncbi:hypothetical protein CMT41_17090 [Colwellia sp. MT41]|uniref:ABC transporter substrate-binding protein n=1 Tax=Colwellia marinimaniae TaxID=1513592 RepID=A0ABQ0MZP5_9GAMM|nr:MULTISPECIES: transporter substrate-binding domain-containing protein [Colwellia]ALO36255.1 hypothetical protein CMT41_17090 [Colwellia sp. MT41]GAW97831.1 ABC transporter substrate-binding protein [Colwellia marinimaniae]
MKYYVVIFSFFCPLVLADVSELSGELRIATYLEPPFVDFVDNQLVGPNIEIVKLLAKALTLKAVFVRCPFARCLSMTKRGQTDMILGLRNLPERQKDLIFIEPPLLVQRQPLRFFTLATKEIVINNFEDLKDLIVGTIRGATYYPQFDNNQTINKVEITSREQLVKMLLKGHIDVILEREESIVPLLPKTEYLQKIALANYQYDKTVNSYIALSRHSANSRYAALLSQHLAVAIENGTIDSIRAKYSH